jgi:hypothetical protein
LVNKGSGECIEIWNLVFIQFNANPDGTFSPLPAQHVDTGMGFERVCSIIQCTRNFQEFSNVCISNYETDVFRPIFDELEKLSGHRYASTLPQLSHTGQLVAVTPQERLDVAFRVIADHIRTLSFAIADGIQPGNTDRNYVLRRILRRAIRYGRVLGFQEPFFFKLVPVLARTMGDVFPEIRSRQTFVEDVLKREEVAFKSEYYQGLHDNSSKFQENNWLLPYVEVISSFNFNSLREVGYGNGKFLREISRTVPRVIGLDWAKSSVFSEQNIEIVQQDIGTADLDYVDVNCSADVLEHLPPDTLRSTLSKLHFSSKFNFHVIACYDDGHSHLSILQPDEWLFLFRQLSSAYNIYNITIRSGNVHKVVCAITNAK